MKDSKKTSTSRRKFVKNSLKATAMIPLSGLWLACLAKTDKKNQANKLDHKVKPLKILILGGSSFLGPHQIAYALKNGHSVTTFTRGKTKPTIHKGLFKNVEQLIGYRENDLEALKNRKWDAVIDNSGRKVAWTTATAQLLKENVGLYVYTSSVSVYYPYLTGNLKEDQSLVLKVPEDVEDEDEKFTYDYGVMKANSENETKRIFGEDRSIIIRPTFMMGPADRTNRFIYWPTQLAKDGDVIIPGKQQDAVQFIDVRDIAEWMIRLIETKTTGTFNGVGPKSKMGIETFVHESAKAFSAKNNFITIDDYDFLKSNNLRFQIPWIVPSKKFYGTSLVNNELAISSGLTYRSLKDSMRDTYDWWYSDAVTEKRRTEYEKDKNELHNRQGALITKWKNK